MTRAGDKGDANDLPLDLPPMEAEAVSELPTNEGWQYEPKWDGFRCLAHRQGESVHLMSKSGKPLARYFPEVAAACGATLPPHTVIDGEIISPSGFEALQLRLHPAASRIAKLSEEDPCRFVVFDALAIEGRSFIDQPLLDRREALEGVTGRWKEGSLLSLGEATRSVPIAKGWLGRPGTDGLMAKRLDGAYRPGERAMLKYKVWTTYDCVVGGITYRNGGPEYLLLGLYDDQGALHYVGRARLGKLAKEAVQKVESFLGGSGFTGKQPSAESRWGARKSEIRLADPLLVVEVSADHVTGGHMRHGARLVRWRPDKNPMSCRMTQIS